MQLAAIIIIGLMVIVLCTLWGSHRGFLKMLIPLCGLFLSLVITRYAVSPVSYFLTEHTGVYTTVKENFKESVPVFGELSTAADERNAIENANLPEFLKDTLIENNNTVVYEELGATSFDDYISSYIAKIITNLIAFIGVLAASFIILRIICAALKIAQSLPILHGISGILGGVVGLLIGIVLAAITTLILCAVFTKTTGLSVLGNIFNNSFMETLSKYNIFINWIS